MDSFSFLSKDKHFLFDMDQINLLILIEVMKYKLEKLHI